MRHFLSLLAVCVAVILSSCSDDSPTGSNSDNPTVADFGGTCGHRMSKLFAEGNVHDDAVFESWAQASGSYVVANGVNRTQMVFDAIATGSGVNARITVEFPGKTPGTFSWSENFSSVRIKVGDSTYTPVEGSTTITEVSVAQMLSAKAKGEFSGILAAPNGTRVAIKGRFTGCP